MWYFMSLTIWSYTILYIFTINVNFHQVTMLTFCNVWTTLSIIFSVVLPSTWPSVTYYMWQPVTQRQQLIQVWAGRSIASTSNSDFNFKFSREEHWLQVFEWRSHIWMAIQISIQLYILPSKSWWSRLTIFWFFGEISGYFFRQNHGIITQHSISYFCESQITGA